MKKVGIIAEYNPFHNGHIYHLERVKELYPDASIVLVLSSHFTQRGIPSILNKWDRASLAMDYGAHLVIELPFAFSVQSSDFFAQGAIEILRALDVQALVFGVESTTSEALKKMAEVQLYHPEFSTLVQESLKKGVNYPTAMNLALYELCSMEVTSPNDLLGLSYMKEILRQKANIQVSVIQRTNSYHAEKLEENISSATSIRKAFLENQEISSVVPNPVLSLLQKQHFSLEEYFPFFQYQVHVCPDLSIYLDVDEGIEHRILKEIDFATSFEDLLLRLKTKRYTYNRLVRMFIHILCGFTKEERAYYLHVPYLRVLGFTSKGREILRDAKKTCSLPIYTKFQKNVPGFQLEKRVTAIYASILPDVEKRKLIMMEYQNKPIQK